MSALVRRSSDRVSIEEVEWMNMLDKIANKLGLSTADEEAALDRQEEELNRIFIDIYGLQDELTPEVEEKDVTVRRADLQRDIKSLISYAVGCMFGRYSVQRDGLVFAGGDWGDAFRESEESKNQHEEALSEAGRALNVKKKVYDEIFIDGAWEKCIFPPDSDNVIPICDDEYFRDDATTRFVEFVKVVYGEDKYPDSDGVKASRRMFALAGVKVREYVPTNRTEIISL